MARAKMITMPVGVGYGIPPKPDFWISRQMTGEGFRESYIAFAAPDRATVRAFFEAFVRDPDGNNVEAVCHSPE